MDGRTKFIAVDFDGTITFPSKYPVTGEIRPDAVRVLKALREKYFLILWTHRADEGLIDAVHMCEDKGISFDFINENPLKGNYYGKKIYYDYVIDDKSYGLNGIIDWDDIYKTYIGENNE